MATQQPVRQAGCLTHLQTDAGTSLPKAYEDVTDLQQRLMSARAGFQQMCSRRSN